MAYPYDGVPRPGLDVPGMRCPLCGRVGVLWMSGKCWSLLPIPPPHFQCNQCGDVFAALPPATSRLKAMLDAEKRRKVWHLP